MCTEEVNVILVFDAVLVSHYGLQLGQNDAARAEMVKVSDDFGKWESKPEALLKSDYQTKNVNKHLLNKKVVWINSNTKHN